MSDVTQSFLVTGGEGFVGRNLVQLFEGRADSYDIKSGLDVTNPQQVEKATAGRIAVAHLAAKISVPESHREPELYHRVNVEGTRTVLEAAIKAGCESILFFSSAAAKDPSNSPYGKSKYDAEQILLAHKDNIHVTIFRPENIYGPGQSKEYAGVITSLIDNATAGKPLQISGDGEQTRDFIWVGDIAELAKRALENHEKIPSGTIYEVGTGTSTSINTLGDYLANRFHVPVTHRPDWDPGILHSKANNTPILDAVGPYTFKPFTQGIDEIIAVKG